MLALCEEVSIFASDFTSCFIGSFLLQYVLEQRSWNQDFGYAGRSRRSQFLAKLHLIRITSVVILLCRLISTSIAEQLDRVEGGLDTINQDMREAEGALKDMEKCCGLFTLPCGK